jgi:hypothetical protein
MANQELVHPTSVDSKRNNILGWMKEENKLHLFVDFTDDIRSAKEDQTL